MSMPKAILCTLGDSPESLLANSNYEKILRAAGFATASIPWKDVSAQQRGWMQLLPLLDDTDVQAWVFAGSRADITDELRFQISMLTLAMQRPKPPATALVLSDGDDIAPFSGLMRHVMILKAEVPFAGKLVAARFTGSSLPKPFHLNAYLDPLIGQWLEVGPAEGEEWPGFMVGLTGAGMADEGNGGEAGDKSASEAGGKTGTSEAGSGETAKTGVPNAFGAGIAGSGKTAINAFGVGKRGALPSKSLLEYQLCGIKGQRGDETFVACAAKNSLNGENACFIRLEGYPRTLLISDYPGSEFGSESGSAEAAGDAKTECAAGYVPEQAAADQAQAVSLDLY